MSDSVMADLDEQRADLLRAKAAGYADVAVKNVRREYPNHIATLMQRDGDAPVRPRDVFPAFYGSFDWHSCVEMHWLLVRLLRAAPDAVPQKEVRAALEENLTEANLAGEAATFRGGRTNVRPYAWAWALALTHELAAWVGDADGARWAGHMRPLAEAVTDAFLAWLPKATYPNRQGTHPNTAFGLSLALPYARMRAENGEPALLDALVDAAQRWYAEDSDSPGQWEPSGSDFLSPTLVEAELMARLLRPAEFGPWFDRFLPRLADAEPAALFEPATVSDDSDGQIAHLRGLNLSRAFCWRRLAESLGRTDPGDPRIPVMRAAAARHAALELDNAGGADYMVEHWLAAYAVLYLT
jgi:hypothetical protein